jgi:cell division protein FtsW (lipid II flippase)
MSDLKQHNRSWHYIYFYFAVFALGLCFVLNICMERVQDEEEKEKYKKGIFSLSIIVMTLVPFVAFCQMRNCER